MAFFRGLLLLLLSVQVSLAQYPGFVHYSTSDGLPSSVVYKIQADPQGYLWFCTNSGLSRFDSKRFLNFTIKDGLPDNEILNAQIDEKGRVWFSPLNGKIGYIDSGRVHPAQGLPSGRRVLSYTNTSSGSQWMLLENGDIVQTRNREIITTVRAPKMSTAQFLEDKLGHIWVFTRSPDTLFYIRDDRLESVAFQKSPQMIRYFPTRGELMANGRILFYGMNFVATLNPINKITEILIQGDKIGDTEIYCIYQHSMYELWVGTSSGIRIFEKKFNRYTWKKTLLEDEIITSITKDPENNLWVSTLGGGIFFSPENHPQIISVHGSNTSSNLTCITGDTSGQIWLGANDGKIYVFGKNGLAELPGQEKSSGPSRLLDATATNDGQVWFAGDRGLIRVTGGSAELVPPKRIALKCIDTWNNHLVCSDFGGIRFFPKNNPATWQYVNTGRTTALCALPGGELLFGNTDGLQALYPDNRVSTVINDSAYGERRISGICYAKNKNMIWISVMGNGIFCFKGNRKIFHVTTENGLTGNNTNDIIYDNDRVFVATQTGISLVELRGDSIKAIRNLNRLSGFINEEVNKLYFRNDTLWAATNGGLAIIPVALFYRHTVTPKIHLEKIWVNGHSFFPAKNQEFAYFENNIKFDFTAISYRTFGNVKYYYRLSGIDTSWVFSQSGSVNYSSLPPGNYEFCVKAVTDDGIETPQIDCTTFIIKAAYWQTNWFRILLVSIVIMITVFSMLIRIRVIKKTEEEKTRLNKLLNELRLNALKAQMNPHFMFNSLNSIQNLINNNQKKEANTYLSKFARLLRMTLDYSDARNILVEEEMNMLRLYLELESLRFRDHFSFSIETGPGVDPYIQAIPPMLIQPFAENAIKHGLLPKKENAHLLIRFEKRNQQLFCIVEDNGIGRVAREKLKTDSDIPHISKGVDITRKRLELFNQTRDIPATVHIIDLYHDDGSAAGTRVEITIPA